MRATIAPVKTARACKCHAGRDNVPDPMSAKDNRIHEVTFCARVKSWSETLFGENADFPFSRLQGICFSPRRARRAGIGPGVERDRGVRGSDFVRVVVAFNEDGGENKEREFRVNVRP